MTNGLLLMFLVFMMLVAGLILLRLKQLGIQTGILVVSVVSAYLLSCIVLVMANRAYLKKGEKNKTGR